MADTTGSISSDAEIWAYEKTQSESARLLWDLAFQAVRENCYRATRAYRFATLFSGYTLTNLQGYGANVTPTFEDTFPGLDFPIVKNRCRTLAKTFIAKSFANDQPEPQFTTRGGNFEQGLKADLLNGLMIADFEAPHGGYKNIHQLHCMGGLIATTSTGRYYVFCIDYDSSTYPECELDDSLTVGVWRAQQHGAIRMMTRIVWMNPEEAVRRFGKKNYNAIYRNVETRSAVFTAGQGIENTGPTKNWTLKRRVVKVIMGWTVRNGDEMGREMFILEDKSVLRDNKEYDYPTPPCVGWDFETSLDGEDPIPLTNSIYRLSLNQNRIINDVDRTERTTPQLAVVIQKGTNGSSVASKSATTKSVLQSKAVQVIPVDGPVDSAWKAFEMPKYSKDSLALEKMYDDSTFEEAQIGRNHATGVKPEGTTSGIQESLAASYYTESFAEAERRAIETRAIGTTRIMLRVCKILAKRKGGFSKWIGEGKFMREVRHTDLDLDVDKYVLDIKAVGEGKDSPKTRLDQAMQLLKDPTVQFTGADLVQAWKNYDVDQLADQAFALQEWCEDQSKKYTKATKEMLADPEFYEPPEIWMQLSGLRLCLSIMTVAYLHARGDKVPQDRLRWFEKFNNDCVALIQAEEKRQALNAAGKPSPAAPPPAPGPQMNTAAPTMPGAVPGPTATQGTQGTPNG